MKLFGKELFLRLWRIIRFPQTEWQTVAHEEPRRDVMTFFVWPMTLICGGAKLLGCLFHEGFRHFGNTILDVCEIMAVMMAAYALGLTLVEFARRRLIKLPDDHSACQLLVGYSFSVLLVLFAFTGLVPELILFRHILQFYLVYVVWEGSSVVTGVSEEERMKFTLLVSAILLLLPMLLQKIMDCVINWLT